MSQVESKNYYSILINNNIFVDPSLKPRQLYEILLIFGLIDNIPTKNKHYGILGWDIAYTPSPWVKAITGDDWNDMLNPIFLKNQTWVHHSNAVSIKKIVKIVNFIRNQKKDGKKYWKSIFPKVIELEDGVMLEPFHDFVTNDDYDTAMVGWEQHMRFVYKKDNNLIFYDPYMQNLDKKPFFKKIKTNVKKGYGYRSDFIRRPEDQSDENSCVIDSLARCLMVAEYGEEAALWPWNVNTFDYIIVAARAIHMFM